MNNSMIENRQSEELPGMEEYEAELEFRAGN